MIPRAAAILLLLLGAQAGKPRELFENGGFETGLAGWRCLNLSGSATFELDAQVKQAGKQSLRVARGKGDKLDFVKGFLDLPVREGALVVSLAYRLDKEAHLAADVYFYDRDGKEVGKGFQLFLDARKPTKGFEVARGEFEIPAAALGFGLNLKFDRAGTAWVDEFSVTARPAKGAKAGPAKPARPGELANADFEQGLEGWSEIPRGSGTLEVVLDTRHKSSGKSALRLARSSPRLFPIDGVRAVLEDAGSAKRWKLSASARMQGGARAALLLRAIDASGVPRECGRAAFPAAAGKDGFARATLELALASTRERLEVELLVEGPGEAVFDALALEGR